MKIKLQDGRNIYIEFRYGHDPLFDVENTIYATQAYTQAYIEVDDFDGRSRRSYVGKAILRPDEVSKHIMGRKYALRYALKEADFKKEEKTEIWKLLVEQGFKLF